MEKRVNLPHGLRLENPLAHRFDEFWMENGYEERDVLRDVREHPIDEHALQDWLRKLEARGQETATLFGTAFARVLRRYSFADVERLVKNVGLDLRQTCEETHHARVYLVIDGGFRKSNTWIALLLWPWIRNHVTHVFVSADELVADVLALEERSVGAFTLAIHPDDATYSGSQIHTAVAQPLTQLRATLGDGLRFRYVIAVAVASTRARSLLDDVAYLQIANAAETMYPMLQALDVIGGTHGAELLMRLDAALEAERRKSGQRVLTDLYQLDDEVHAVYFDHKLADSISVLNKVLAVSPVPGPPGHEVDGAISTGRSLISFCRPDDYTADDTGARGVDLAPLGIFDFQSTAVCPLPYYKNVPYRWRGSPLDSNDLDRTVASLLRVSRFGARCVNPGCPNLAQAVCAGCNRMPYCAGLCSQADWPRHEKECARHDCVVKFFRM